MPVCSVNLIVPGASKLGPPRHFLACVFPLGAPEDASLRTFQSYLILARSWLLCWCWSSQSEFSTSDHELRRSELMGWRHDAGSRSDRFSPTVSNEYGWVGPTQGKSPGERGQLGESALAEFSLAFLARGASTDGWLLCERRFFETSVSLLTWETMTCTFGSFPFLRGFWCDLSITLSY